MSVCFDSVTSDYEYEDSDVRELSDLCDISSEYDENSSISDLSDTNDESGEDQDLNGSPPSKRICLRQPYKCSLNNHFMIYSLKIPSNQFNYQKVLTSLKEEALDLFEEIEIPSFKFTLTINCSFKRIIEERDEFINNWFRSTVAVKIGDENLEYLIDVAVNQIEVQIENFVKLGSGKKLFLHLIFPSF